MHSDQTELNEEQYNIFRETEANLTKGKARTNKVKRKKKYVSPYRREAYVPVELVCAECKLPSTKGLPPFVAVNRIVDGEIRKTLRHYACPQDADAIMVLVQRQRDKHLEDVKRWRKNGGRVVTTSNRTGKEVRTVIA